MSAWIVTKNHIDTLVSWAFNTRTPVARALGYEDRDALGRLLWAENLRSVSGRYPGDVSGGRPGPVGFTDEQVTTYTFAPPRPFKSTVPYYVDFDPSSACHALKQAECYDYQSCESPDYRETPAGILMQHLITALHVACPRADDDDSDINIPWGV